MVNTPQEIEDRIRRNKIRARRRFRKLVGKDSIGRGGTGTGSVGGGGGADGQMDFSNADDSGLIALLEDI